MVEGVCPVADFAYGPHGDIYRSHAEELASMPTQEMADDIPLPQEPPQFNEDGTGSKPPTDQKKENAFWSGMMVGVAIFTGVIVSIALLFLCCKKRGTVSASGADAAQY